MRKNLINYGNIIRCSKKQAVARFKRVYGVTSEDLQHLTQLSSYSEKVFYAADLLFRRSVEKGMRKCDAIAQTTNANIAVLVTGWEQPESDVRRIGSVVSREYRGSAREDGMRKISMLRQEVLRGESLNMENPQKNPDGTRFSYYDQLDGLKLMPCLGHNQFFLLGVYRADGYPISNEKNTFRLSGKTGDDEFYKKIVERLIAETFNLKVRTTVHSRERFHEKRGKTYSWQDVYLRVISQGHFLYLQNYIGLFDRRKRFRPIDIEDLGEKKGMAGEYGMAYLMGMIAAAGHMGERSSGRVQFKFNDTDQRYMPELKRMIKEAGLPVEYYFSPRKGRYMHINHANLEKMVEIEVPFVIAEGQRGLFVNQRHLASLREYGFIR